MQPFFEWDFKAMPLVVGFFQRAAAGPRTDQMDINSRTLSAIYQFIRGMPSVYIESRLKQQLHEVCATEMELKREQLELALKLEDIDQRKRSITRRLIVMVGVWFFLQYMYEMYAILRHDKDCACLHYHSCINRDL